MPPRDVAPEDATPERTVAALRYANREQDWRSAANSRGNGNERRAGGGEHYHRRTRQNRRGNRSQRRARCAGVMLDDAHCARIGRAARRGRVEMATEGKRHQRESGEDKNPHTL